MKITQVDNCPPGLQYFDKDDLESKLQPQDIEDIVEIVDERLGKDQAYLLDPEKITDELGWQAQVSLDEGIKRCANWHHRNFNVISSLPQSYRHKP